MTRIETIIESQETSIRLTAEEAEALELVGTRLASQKRWWRDEEPVDRSIIRCHRSSVGSWTVLVREAIGAISVKGLQLTILPKIPASHFLYLAAQSGEIPRVSDQAVDVASGVDLWKLIAMWYVKAAGRLLQRELTKGYVERIEYVDTIRGKIVPLDTALEYYRGSKTVCCEFEDFDADIALNRVVRAAAEIIASGDRFELPLRRRAKAILARMDGVGDFRFDDMSVAVDRLTQHYGPTLAFAKFIIKSSGVHFVHGPHLGWSFLIRTPGMIEAGVRETLTQYLRPRWRVAKRRIGLRPSAITLNPDLVINDGWVTGDVKYALTQQDWQRQHLYQAIAFAAGFGAQAAAVIGFRLAAGDVVPESLVVGDIRLRHFVWDASPAIEPGTAGIQLASEIDGWLRSVPVKQSSVGACSPVV